MIRFDITCCLTAVSTSPAASCILTCSQKRRTPYPSSTNALSVPRSRFRVAAIFACHQSRLFTGMVRCCVHPCQKHPSTKITTRALLKKISARLLGRPGIGTSTRYLRPRLCSSRRKASSGAVSRTRTTAMRRETDAELGCGRAITQVSNLSERRGVRIDAAWKLTLVACPTLELRGCPHLLLDSFQAHEGSSSASPSR